MHIGGADPAGDAGHMGDGGVGAGGTGGALNSSRVTERGRGLVALGVPYISIAVEEGLTRHNGGKGDSGSDGSGSGRAGEEQGNGGGRGCLLGLGRDGGGCANGCR